MEGVGECNAAHLLERARSFFIIDFIHDDIEHDLLANFISRVEFFTPISALDEATVVSARTYHEVYGRLFMTRHGCLLSDLCAV